jgi:putative membrane protein
MSGWGSSGWGAGEWIAMSAMMLVFWGVLISLGVWGVHSVQSHRGQVPSDRAANVLAERFARGEIDDKEFTRSRELLDTGGSSASRSGR